MIFNKRWAAPLMAALMLAALPALAQTGGADTKAPPSAQAVVDAAVKTAKASGKSVLIHFGASW